MGCKRGGKTAHGDTWGGEEQSCAEHEVVSNDIIHVEHAKKLTKNANQKRGKNMYACVY